MLAHLEIILVRSGRCC